MADIIAVCFLKDKDYKVFKDIKQLKKFCKENNYEYIGKGLIMTKEDYQTAIAHYQKELYGEEENE